MSQLLSQLEYRHVPSSTASANKWDQRTQKLSLPQFPNNSSAATEEMQYILERRIHRKRWFKVVVSVLKSAGMQACTLQYCKCNRMEAEPAEAEHVTTFLLFVFNTNYANCKLIHAHHTNEPCAALPHVCTCP